MKDSVKIIKNLNNFFIDSELVELSEKFGLIEPLLIENLSGNSYDLRVGRLLSSRNRSSTFEIYNKSYFIESGEVVTINTLEKINFFSMLSAGIICNKHSILAKGLFHPITTIDPGFNDILAVTFINLGNTRYEIKYGDKIAKLLVYPLHKLPTNIYGKTQKPSYREGSLEIATIFNIPDVQDDSSTFAKMYGKPLKYLYERIEKLENELSFSDIRREHTKMKESANALKSILFALLSGISGALLATFWKDIIGFIKKIIISS